MAGEAVQTTQLQLRCGRGLQPPMRSLGGTHGTQTWSGGGPPTHTPCPRQETKEPPLKPSAMGEMEQLAAGSGAAQEADRSNPRTPPSHQGTWGNQEPSVAPRGRAGFTLIDISETPDLEVPRRLLNLELRFEMCPLPSKP